MQKRETMALVLLFLAALALRLFRLSNQSLWMDEISSIETARVPLSDIVARSAQNNALPTYFLLLRPMVGTTNQHIEIRARLISVLAGALSVPVFAALAFCWCRQALSALVAGVLLAINPLHLWYSQETRGYVLMLLFGLCCLLSFELARSPIRLNDRREDRPHVTWWWWSAYILTALLAVAVHKTGLVFPLGCALWDTWAFLRDRKKIASSPASKSPASLLRLAPHLVLVAILGLILIEPSQPPAPEYGRPNSILEIAYTAMTFVGGYSFGPSLTEIQNAGPKPAVLHHLVQTGIVATALVLFAAVLIWRGRSVLRGRAALLLILPLLVGYAGAAFSNFPYNVRYTLPALFGFLGLIAALPLIVPKRCLSCAITALILAVNVCADVQWFFKPVYRKNDSRAVAQWLAAHSETVKSWTVLPDYLGYSVRWYLGGDQTVLAGEQRPKQERSTSFPPVSDVLIIGRRHHVKDPDAVVRSYREAAGEVRAVNSFAGFELYVREKK